MKNHPDWMYELYQECSTRHPKTYPEWEKKRPEEKAICPMRFQFKDDKYLWMLESKGLI